ncbi:hypothetical protein SH611_20870 [Geminicoccaceae bacterium 1502E]|nr:hypothetical protein [Geminicoccaceae bacterium 1502E]
MLRAVLTGFALLLVLYGVRAGATQNTQMADARCHDYRELRRQLVEDYREEPVSTALAADGRLLQVFASEEFQTWTMLVVEPRGFGCLMATGRAWQDLEALGAGARA